MDEKFAHGSGESDLEGFALGGEVGVEGFNNGVRARGDKGRHVEGASGLGSTATDHAFAFEGAAVAIARSQASEGGDLLAGEGAEFRDGGKKAGGGELANAYDLGQAGDFALKRWVSGNEFLDLGLDVDLLLLEVAEDFFDGGDNRQWVSLLEAVIFGGNQPDELIAALDSGFQFHLGLCEDVSHTGLKTITIG